MTRTFGHIEGVEVGANFPSRAALRDAGVHPPPDAGICGGEREGAESIVLSGGYEDDQDYGDTIIYTGHGGRDRLTGKQVADQRFERGNKALARSRDLGQPVRVIRGHRDQSKHAPKTGYRYDGLFRVDDYWKEEGKSGHLVYRFRLVALEEGKGTEPVQPPQKQKEPQRVEQTVLRIVRDTELGKKVKRL